VGGNVTLYCQMTGVGGVDVCVCVCVEIVHINLWQLISRDLGGKATCGRGRQSPRENDDVGWHVSLSLDSDHILLGTVFHPMKPCRLSFVSFLIFFRLWPRIKCFRAR
jgi:hypothetical protein